MSNKNIDSPEMELTGIQAKKTQSKLSTKGIVLDMEWLQKERSDVFKSVSKIKEKIGVMVIKCKCFYISTTTEMLEYIV